MAAGFSPVEFWDQSPRSYVAIMEGAARRAKAQHESETALAWQTAAFSGAAQAGKLKPLSKYLPKPAGPKTQTTDEMLAVFRTLAERGTPMNIRQVH